MTTHNTQFEHNDVDTNAVEQPLTPETAEVDPGSAVPGASTPVAATEQAPQDETPKASIEEAHIPPTSEHQATTGPVSQENVGEQAEEVPTNTHPTTHTGKTGRSFHPLAVTEEEVRPFTEFIEEFRLAEARLNTPEVFNLLTPAEEEKAVVSKATGSEEMLSTTTTFEQPILTVAEAVQEEAAITEEKIEKQARVKEAEKEETQEAEEIQEQAVSPLLRPPSRLRLPRHGARHQQRESAVSEETKTTGEQKEEAKAEEVAPTSTESSATPSEAPAEVEKPRPARRYRFDRPHKTSAPAPQVAVQSARIEESRSVPAAANNQHVQQEQAAETPTKAIAQQATNGTVNGGSTQTKTQEEAPQEQHTTPGRRRQEQRTAKEQPTPQQLASALELVSPAQEQAKQVEEIAPEDLPPLEYADLQKATSSRRRRRHRTSTGSAGNANNNAAAPTVPAAAQPTPVAPPRPVSPVPTQPAQYSIVSGYTVSQMNQGTESSGPFMAPDPSPARGSLITRDVRSPRAEVVRTTAPSYPMRTGSQEGGLSTTAMNQFANVIGQAIQAQTDRMVTELRRVTQAPTNVSVSLPPFPSTERVGVFVDVANLLYSARTLRMAVDFGKLLDFLRGNRRLVRAQAYCPTSPQPGDEQMFLQAVKGLGYRITTKNYKTFSSGAKKADLDLDLCMDVVRLVDGKAVDCIALVSGDSDFMPMLDYCSDHGVRVEVAAFDEAMSATLRQSCDLFINLSMLEEIRA